MSTFVLLTITGLGLGAMYFLIASGRSLLYGLMGVLNFAHGARLTVGAYATWWMSDQVGGGLVSIGETFAMGDIENESIVSTGGGVFLGAGGLVRLFGESNNETDVDTGGGHGGPSSASSTSR